MKVTGETFSNRSCNRVITALNSLCEDEERKKKEVKAKLLFLCTCYFSHSRRSSSIRTFMYRTSFTARVYSHAGAKFSRITRVRELYV